jgi:hypothetical protein
MITLSSGLKLTEADMIAISEVVAQRIAPPAPDQLSMEEAAVELGLRCSTQRSLSAAFSKFGSIKHYARPLRGTRIGRVTTYLRQDVIEFKKNRTKK